MSDWRVHLKGQRDIAAQGDTLTVRFASGRSQVVTVSDAGERLVLTAVAARAAALTGLSDPDQRAWAINRSVDLVGFRVDERGRFVGEAWLPKPGLTAAEFLLVARRLAAECDRMEYVLTGEDRE